MLQNNRFIVFISFLLLAFSLNVWAITQLPQDFIYQGKPIDPLCFDQSDRADDHISLIDCGAQTEKDLKISGSNNERLADGFIGYDFVEKNDNNHDSQTYGFSYYKIIGQYKRYYVILTLNNGGGSGIFTTLNLIQRIGNNLHIKLMESGDRCNGGIVHAHIDNTKDKGNYLSYAINVTSFDILELSDQNNHGLRAYHDLDACAVCCIGVAYFERNLARESEDAVLDHIELKKQSSMNANSGGIYQSCFNKLLIDYQKRDDYNLNKEKLKEFVQTFNSQCVK